MNNDNNNFIKLLKKAFHLNLQCEICKNTPKKCCFIFTINTSTVDIRQQADLGYKPRPQTFHAKN